MGGEAPIAPTKSPPWPRQHNIPGRRRFSSPLKSSTFSVRYDPLLKPGILKDDRFSATPHSASFFIGASDFGNGLGALSIFIGASARQSLLPPISILSSVFITDVLVVPLATQVEIWQTHDVPHGTSRRCGWT